VYNLASGVETSILQLATLINELAGNSTPLQFLPKRAWDRSGKRFGSTEKAHRALGFQAEIPLHDGIEITIEWTRANLSWIEACMQKHHECMESA
jgi:nucleoside-diphosphate-sugar epimerase